MSADYDAAVSWCASQTANPHGISLSDLPFDEDGVDEVKFMLGAEAVPGLREDYDDCMDEVIGD